MIWRKKKYCICFRFASRLTIGALNSANRRFINKWLNDFVKEIHYFCYTFSLSFVILISVDWALVLLPLFHWICKILLSNIDNSIVIAFHRQQSQSQPQSLSKSCLRIANIQFVIGPYRSVWMFESSTDIKNGIARPQKPMEYLYKAIQNNLFYKINKQSIHYPLTYNDSLSYSVIQPYTPIEGLTLDLFAHFIFSLSLSFWVLFCLKCPFRSVKSFPFHWSGVNELDWRPFMDLKPKRKKKENNY